MKSYGRVFLAAVICLASGVCPVAAQTYQLQVLNQSVQSVTPPRYVQFDIYLWSNPTNSIYLGDCDLVLTFDSSKFTGAGAQTVVEGLSGFYTIGPTIVAGNRFVVNVQKPGFSNQQQFNTRVTQISSTGDGSLIGTFRITNLSNLSGSAGLRWRNVTPNMTILTTLDPDSAWPGTNITDTLNHVQPGDLPLPITLVSFQADIHPQGRGVWLKWTTLNEIDNYGFNVQRRPASDTTFRDLLKGFVTGHGTTAVTHTYSFIDSTVAMAGGYFYRLRQVDLDGAIHYSPTVGVNVPTSAIAGEIPTEFKLLQNYPNPFNPSTTVRYGLPQRSTVELTLFNMLGQQVATLVNGEQEAGYHEVRLNGASLASGVYFYRLKAGSFLETKKLILVR